MKLLLALALLSGQVMAQEIVRTTIADVLSNGTIDTETKVMANINGRIYYAASSDVALIGDLEAAKMEGRVVELTIANDDETVESVEFTNEIVAPILATDDKNIIGFNFEMSNVSSLTEAQSAFNTMNTSAYHSWLRKSQCYNRAHRWAHDLWQQRNLKTTKVYLFFTKRMNRECNSRTVCKWWFHVAPSINVAGTEMMLDREFTKGPMEVFPWAKKFVEGYERETGRTVTACPVVNSYVEYEQRNAADSDICLIRKAPMYYWDPRSVENFDKAKEVERNSFVDWEVTKAHADFAN
jgi:hypothetical protein